LGWAPVTAAAGGLIGALVLAATLGIKPGIFFIISTAIAPVLISHLALINRPAGASGAAEGEAADNDVQWYPEGRLILWCGLIACALMTLTIFVIGSGAEGFQAIVKTSLDTLVAQIAEGVDPDELAKVQQAIAVFARFAAPIAACVWLLSTLFNLWAASRILDASQRSPRPWAPFSSYALPRTSTIAMAVAVAASFMPGTLGLIGLVGIALMTTIFTIIGLAALHGVTMGNPMRPFILATTYLALFVLSWVVMLPLVILALADLMFNLRQRRAASMPGPND
ncbi:MAG: hypothetical protein ACR2OM_10060, partial [Aestuariivirgaceae bacterium]